MRPATLDEVVGQPALLAPGGALREAIAGDRVPSMVLYGPPGSGKTTIARVVAHTTAADFEELSAVSATVADVRAVLTRARDRLAGGGRTVLFLDEIHRFNRAQQDALLPAVEDGLVTLIGATTQNPWYEVNAALVSRMRVFVLEPLGPEEVAGLIDRALAAPRGPGRAGAPGRRGAGRSGRPRQRRRPRRAQPAGGRRRRDARRPGGHPRVGPGGLGGPLGGLRPRGRRSLRHDLGLHQEPARERPRRRHLLPGRDAGGRRGPEVHRPPPDRARRARTSATPTRARSRWRWPPRARSSSWACPRRASTSPRRRHTSRLHPSRTRHTRAINEALARVEREGARRPPLALRDASRANATQPRPRRGISLSRTTAPTGSSTSRCCPRAWRMHPSSIPPIADPRASCRRGCASCASAARAEDDQPF